ncbi:MAG: aldolase/citrate lyase family protein [Firmicutes bacterium]|nr:aldolase/citrate lyase family protein [Bacillota bacterium]
MIESYMFIPANKKKYIIKSETLADLKNRIFDLEDSIMQKEFEKSLAIISEFNIMETDWIRMPAEYFYRTDILKRVNKIGINRFVIPKFNGYTQLNEIVKSIINVNSKAKFILLIENAISYVEIERIIKEYNHIIHGISLGIHDFTYNTGMLNDYKTLRNIRTNIMLLSKAYSIKPIDIASMNLTEEQDLKDEVIDGYNIGYRAKLLIHPNQLEIINKIEFYSLKEIEDLKSILEYYYESVKGKNALFSYKGRVYEKMHIEEMKNIIEWGKNYYGTDW